MAEDQRADLTNLQTKMKLLQRHQVFEAEILAHGNVIASLLQVNHLFSLFYIFKNIDTSQSSTS